MVWIVGGLAMGALYVALGVVNVSGLVLGRDGRPSTSKFQALAWTVAVLYGYLVLIAGRWIGGDWTVAAEIPTNLLLVMGLSGGTAVTAAVFPGAHEPATAASAREARWLGLDDNGVPDLAKTQLLAWTFVGLLVYALNLVREVHAGHFGSLPDLDSTLMVLMGVGHAGYLGGKVVTAGRTEAAARAEALASAVEHAEGGAERAQPQAAARRAAERVGS